MSLTSATVESKSPVRSRKHRSDRSRRQSEQPSETAPDSLASRQHCEVLILQAELASLKEKHRQELTALRRESEVLQEQLNSSRQRCQNLQDQLQEQQYWQVQGLSSFGDTVSSSFESTGGTFVDVRGTYSVADYIKQEEEKKEEALAPKLARQAHQHRPVILARELIEV